jgi:hypothetical protein
MTKSGLSNNIAFRVSLDVDPSARQQISRPEIRQAKTSFARRVELGRLVNNLLLFIEDSQETKALTSSKTSL